MNKSPTIISLGNKSTEWQVLSQGLRQAGYRVLEVSSEAEASSLINQEQPVLIILNDENDERFRTLADNAPVLMWMNGPDGCEFVNREYLRFLGVTDVDVRGYDWSQFVHPDDRKTYVTSYLEAVVDRRFFEATFRFRRHDGEYRWMKSVGTPRFSADGIFLGYVGSTIDVNDIRFATQPLVRPRAAISYRPYHIASSALALMTAAIASLVLVGWAFGFTRLTSLSPEFASMKVTTALGLLCAAGSLLLLHASKFPPLAFVLASVPGLLGIGTLLGYAVGTEANVEHPGWMAPGTAICLALLALALGTFRSQTQLGRRVSESSVVTALLIGVLALIGYLNNEQSLYAVKPFVSMALHTALSIVLLSLALLCIKPDRGLMATVTALESGGLMLRRMLPLTVGMAVAVGWVRLAGEQTGWFDHYFGLTVVVGLSLAGFSAILWSVASLLNQEEEKSARLAALVTSATDAIISKTLTGIVTTWNPAAERLFGYTAEEMIGQPITRVIPPDRQEEETHMMERLARGETIKHYDTIRRRKAGTDMMISLTVSPLYDREGKVIGASKIARDITERKQAEEALQERNRQLELLALASQRLLLGGEAEQELLETIFGDIAQLIDMDIFYHYRLDESLRMFHTSGGITEKERSLFATMRFGELLCGRVAEAQTRIIIEDLQHSTHPGSDVLRAAGATSYAGFPLVTKGELVGTIAFTSNRRTHLREGDVLMIQTICDQIATALERTRLQRELRESEARFRTMAEAVPSFLFETNAAGWNTWTSDGWCRFTGQSPADAAGHGWADALHPVDRAADLDRWAECMRTGTPFESRQRLRRADGRYAWVVARALPVRDVQGTIPRWVGSVTDVDEIVRAEQQLRESEERFRNVFEHAATGIAIAQLDGRFVQSNPAFCTMLGYTEEELRDSDRVFADLIHPDDRAENLAKVKQLLAERLPSCEIESRYMHKNGEPVWAHKSISLLRDDAREPKYLSVLVTNVTERRRADVELCEARERLQRWNVELEQAVNVKTSELKQSHERLRAFATELNLAEQRERTRIATELHDHLQQMLVLGKLKLGMHKRFTETAPAAAKVMKETDEVLSDALTYSRILVAELSPPVLRDHGLAAGFKWLADSMKQKYGMTVTVTVPEENGLKLPEDQTTLLFQSVRELLINSWKHAGTRQATVSMEQRDGLLLIFVSDTGAGFDLAAAAAAADTPSGGISSKFGLFSIRERMRALDGSFDIESSPGRGTTATLVLPLATPIESGENNAVRPLSPVARVSLANRASRNTIHDHLIRVLLVDDHAMVRQGLGAILNGYPDIELVGEAADGEEAVALAERLRPTVILMDINMPKKNGIVAAAEIKARHPEMIVIGLSVNTNGENHTKMMEAGASMLLSKEAAVEHLYGVIHDVLREQA